MVACHSKFVNRRNRLLARAVLKLVLGKLEDNDHPGEYDSLRRENTPTSDRSNKTKEEVWPEAFLLTEDDENTPHQ